MANTAPPERPENDTLAAAKKAARIASPSQPKFQLSDGGNSTRVAVGNQGPLSSNEDDNANNITAVAQAGSRPPACCQTEGVTDVNGIASADWPSNMGLAERKAWAKDQITLWVGNKRLDDALTAAALGHLSSGQKFVAYRSAIIIGGIRTAACTNAPRRACRSCR